MSDTTYLESLSIEELKEVKRRALELQRIKQAEKKVEKEQIKLAKIEARVQKTASKFKANIDKLVKYGYTTAQVKKFFNDYIKTIPEPEIKEES